MSMSDDGRAVRIARWLCAVVVGGILAGVVFLILIQEAQRRGHTSLDFNHTLGTIVLGGDTANETSRSALGIIGDPAAPRGLVTSMVLAILMMAVHALVLVPLVRRGWLVQGLALSAITFLAVGLIYPPLASDYLDEPLGPFGSGFGTSTVVSFAVASLGFGMIGSRCYSLIVSAGWWVPRGEDLEKALEEVDMGGLDPLEHPDSLELTE